MHDDECRRRKEQCICLLTEEFEDGHSLEAAAMQAYIPFSSSSRTEHEAAVSNNDYGNLKHLGLSESFEI